MAGLEGVSLALQAFDKGPWPRMDGRRRGQILFKLADLMEVCSRGLYRHAFSFQDKALCVHMQSHENPELSIGGAGESGGTCYAGIP